MMYKIVNLPNICQHNNIKVENKYNTGAKKPARFREPEIIRFFTSA